MAGRLILHEARAPLAAFILFGIPGGFNSVEIPTGASELDSADGAGGTRDGVQAQLGAC